MRKLNLAWIVAIVLLPGTVFLPAACQNNKPVSVKETLQQMAKVPGINAGTGTFDILTPDGWKKTEKKMGGLHFTVLLAPKTADAPFQSSVTVLSQALESSYFDKFFSGVVLEAEKTMQVTGKGKKDINGLSCKWLRFSGASNGHPIDAFQYVVPGGNGIVYVITCGTPSGQMEKYQPAFDEAVNSFQIHGMLKVSK